MPTVTDLTALGNYGANLALNTLFRPTTTLYLGLHIAAPDGPLPNELAGGGYLRDNIAFGPPSGRAVVSVNSQTFAGLVADVVRYLGIWDSISQGNLLARINLAAVGGLITVTDGKVQLAPGDIAIKF